MISVEIKSVVKNFGAARALDGISLTINPGELFFLLGPSGCGKTTLLRSLAGFYIPDGGSILFGGDDVTHVEPHLRNTGMMFQSYALWPHMSVLENVSFGLEMRGLGKAEIAERAKAALDSVKMGHLAERKPNALSGGQQQRVALARALVVRPRCLLLDEPLSNLDAKLRLEMRSEIRRVCKEFGLTTIYVTHDQKEALSVADRMAVLDGGKLLQLGTPLEVYQRPRSKFVAEFIGETNFLPGTVLRSSPGTALVKTALGELVGVVPEGENAAAGSQVTLSVRPECVRLERQPVEENGFAGHIGESTYYGESAQHILLAGDEKSPVRLKVTEFNPRFLGSRGGDQVFAWVDPDDVVVLSR